MGEPAGARSILPDGCVDIVGSPGGPLRVAGPATVAFDVDGHPGGSAFGVRFRTGAGEAVLGTRVDELRDADTDLDTVWPAGAARRLADRVDRDGDGAATALDRLQSALAGELEAGSGPDPVVIEAVARIRLGDGRVNELGRAVGISDRQLRRRFDRAVGYGPKQLARVIRFQRALTMGLDASAVRPGPTTWASIAAASGYSDQSHLVNEFTALAGATPTVVVRERFTTSDSSKTAVGEVA